MGENQTVVISFKDLEVDEEAREAIDKRCGILGDEFPETTRFEITISPDGSGHTAHARVHARQTEVDTHASASELRLAADQALDKVERQLRRAHDKRIFSRRREAQKASPKRGG